MPPANKEVAGVSDNLLPKLAMPLEKNDEHGQTRSGSESLLREKRDHSWYGLHLGGRFRFFQRLSVRLSASFVKFFLAS